MEWMKKLSALANHPLGKIGQVLLGIALGWYGGIYIVVPAVTYFLVRLMARKWLDRRRLPIIEGFAIQTGQVVSGVAVMLVARTFSLTWIDSLILIVGLAWLLFRPGLGPTILLSLFQLASLVINVLTIISYEFGSMEHKALIVHIFLRVWALGAMIYGLVVLRQQQAAETQEGALPPISTTPGSESGPDEGTA